MVNLWKSKTVWTGVLGIVAAAGGYATGDLSGVDALQTGLNCLMCVFIRMGVEKIGQ